MKYVITGTGRCGTGYVSKLLSSAGSNCTHEGVFTLHGCEVARERVELRREHPEWSWEGDSSWIAAPCLGQDWLEGVKVVHLVRHPVAVIRSQLRMGKWTGRYARYVKYAHRHLAGLANLSDTRKKGVRWWIGWNRMIEPYADYTHRIDIDEDAALLDFLGIDWEDKELFNNTLYNTRTIYNIDFRMKDLPEAWRKKLTREMARYGYD